MDFDNRVFVIGAMAGVVLMLASFVAYVLDPNNTFELVFILGLVLLVAGYLISYFENRKVYREYDAMCDDDDTVEAMGHDEKD